MSNPAENIYPVKTCLFFPQNLMHQPFLNQLIINTLKDSHPQSLLCCFAKIPPNGNIFLIFTNLVI